MPGNKCLDVTTKEMRKNFFSQHQNSRVFLFEDLCDKSETEGRTKHSCSCLNRRPMFASATIFQNSNTNFETWDTLIVDVRELWVIHGAT